VTENPERQADHPAPRSQSIVDCSVTTRRDKGVKEAAAPSTLDVWVPRCQEGGFSTQRFLVAVSTVT